MSDEKKPVEEIKADPKEGLTKEETPQTEEQKSEETIVEVPEKFVDIVEKLEKMSVLDLSELVKVLEDKFGVSAAAPMAMAIPGAAGTDEEAAEEKSEFDVELTAMGDNKIGVIKAIREVTEKGLAEAKEMTENAPVIVKPGVKKEEAEEMKKKLEEAGATVTLK